MHPTGSYHLAELMATLTEKDIVISRISQGITDAVNSLNGLCSTLNKDCAQPVPLELRQTIENTCLRLKRYLLFQEGERTLLV